MPTIGDVIFSTRSRIPDMPQTIVPPVIVSATGINYAAGQAVPGTYFIVATSLNQWGETTASNEVQCDVATGQNAISIELAVAKSSSQPQQGTTAVRIYVQFVEGQENFYQEFDLVPNYLNPVTIYFDNTADEPGQPPTFNSAYLLDTDGQQFSASLVYRWLNEGLNAFTRTVGGILDYAGVPTVAGQSMYVAPGQWSEISDVWYGGYWVQGGKRSQYFRRNTVQSSVLSQATVSVYSDKQVIEVSYQPDRTAGVTTTLADMSAADTGVPVYNPGAFLLPFGFCKIGNEICAYANVANGLLSGLIRGLGSTIATTWPQGTAVTELSLFWCGKRMTLNHIPVGSSLSNLPVPQGWAVILPEYMLAQAKKSERDMAGAEKLEQNFYALAKEWLVSNKPPQRFVQVGGPPRTAVFNPVLGQGVIVP